MHVKELFDLKDEVAIVTGGSMGLGRQMAFGLAEAGTNVVICARKLERCEATAREIETLGVKTLPIKCDTTNIEDIQNLAERTLREFGKIDILVNNAGATWGAPAEEIKIENWIRVTNVNLIGTFMVSQLIGKEMIKRRKGNIINVTSATGFVGSDPATQDAIPYNTTKGALITFTKDLAVKWIKYGIRVNGIAPGWFPTHLSAWALEQFGAKIKEDIPMQRFGGEDELKGAVLYLASKASSYVTGHILVVDGGFLAW